MIIYTAEGRVAVQNMLIPRPVVPVVPQGPDSVSACSDQQARAVVESYDAYYGTFEVDDAHQVVRHLVEGELRPSLVGAVYGRHFAFRDGRLLLSSENPEERWQYVWSSVK